MPSASRQAQREGPAVWRSLKGLAAELGDSVVYGISLADVGEAGLASRADAIDAGSRW